MSHATITLLLILEGTGLAILIAFGIAAYMAYRKFKEGKTKFQAAVDQLWDMIGG